MNIYCHNRKDMYDMYLYYIIFNRRIHTQHMRNDHNYSHIDGKNFKICK